MSRNQAEYQPEPDDHHHEYLVGDTTEESQHQLIERINNSGRYTMEHHQNSFGETIVQSAWAWAPGDFAHHHPARSHRR